MQKVEFRLAPNFATVSTPPRAPPRGLDLGAVPKPGFSILLGRVGIGRPYFNGLLYPRQADVSPI